MSFRCLFAKSRHGVLSCLDTLPNRPDWWSAAERVVFLQGCPLSTQQELELCQREHWLLGPSLPIARIGWMACFSKSPADSRLLPFMDDGGHHVNVLTEIFNAAAIFFLPLSRSMAQHNPDFKDYRQFVGLFFLGLCSNMHYQLWDLTQTGVYLSKSCLIN